MARSVSKSRSSAPIQGGTEFLEAAANDCPHGLMVEQDGRVVYANPAYARLAGFSAPAAVMGKAVAGLSVKEAPARKPEANGHDGRPEIDTLRLQFRRGRRALTLHVVRDVSERRRLEQRLRESEKMEALGRLVGGVAHDFNNVLTAITLYSDLLLERTDRRREAEEIHLAAQRGISLVRQLLTFARQQPLDPRLVSLRAIVSSMRGMLDPLLGENIELISRFDCADDTVRVDPAQIQQVILNLVMNARDAMPGGGHIRISTAACALNGRSAVRHPGLQAGNYVSLSVSDTGCGMNEHVRARMFEPFFTTKRVGDGIGLGMAMVDGIVRQSGGQVSVASKPGKGTRVTILLPHCEAAGHLDESAAGIRHMPVGSETILVAEDDHAVRTSIAHLLTESGYHVLQARDGEQAVRLARAHNSEIDLVIADIVMPGISGYDAAQQIQKLHPETRTLFISGYPAKARATAAGATILYKPFSRAVLGEKVRAILDRRSHLIAAGTRSPQERELP